MTKLQAAVLQARYFGAELVELAVITADVCDLSTERRGVTDLVGDVTFDTLFFPEPRASDLTFAHFPELRASVLIGSEYIFTTGRA